MSGLSDNLGGSSEISKTTSQIQEISIQAHVAPMLQLNTWPPFYLL